MNRGVLFFVVFLSTLYASYLLNIVDCSGSMAGTPSSSSVSKMEITKNALTEIINKYNGLLAIMAFYGCEDDDDPFSGDIHVVLNFTDNKTEALNSLSSLTPSGFTPIIESLDQAKIYLQSQGIYGDCTVILLTDGEESCYIGNETEGLLNAMEELKNATNCELYVLGFDVGSSTNDFYNKTLKDHYFNVHNETELHDALETLSFLVSYVPPTFFSGVYNSSFILVNVSSTYVSNYTISLFDETLNIVNTSVCNNVYTCFVNFSGLSEGLYYFNATVCKQGNCTTLSTQVINLSFSSPPISNTSSNMSSNASIPSLNITILSPTNGSNISSPINFTYVLSLPYPSTLFVFGVVNKTFSCSNTFCSFLSYLPAGWYDVMVQSCNVTCVSKNVTFYVFEKPSSCTLQLMLKNWALKPIMIERIIVYDNSYDYVFPLYLTLSAGERKVLNLKNDVFCPYISGEKKGLLKIVLEWQDAFNNKGRELFELYVEH